LSFLGSRVLLGRSLPAIRSCRRLQQAGFMPNPSTIDQLSALRRIIEKTREFRKGRHLYIAFIHLKSAFNSVDHASLWAILSRISVPGKNLRLFKKLYRDSQSCVRITGKLSEWFNINMALDKDVYLLQTFSTALLTTSCHALCGDPGLVFRQPPSC